MQRSHTGCFARGPSVATTRGISAKETLWITNRRRRRQWTGILVSCLVAWTLSVPLARGDYVESFQLWQSTYDGLWHMQDLSEAPFSVPANAVVEIAIGNKRWDTNRSGGVRTVGSSLDRRFLLHEAEDAGRDVVVMHVQTDSSARIEHYAQNASDIEFILLGYWDSGTYVEAFEPISAGTNASWQDHDLDTYGVGPDEVAEIVIVNTNPDNEREAGVRTSGSSLDRKVDLHEAEDGGVDATAMFVQTDASVNATIEVYAEVAADVVCYLVGYWSTPPQLYTELFSDIGSPSADATWEDKDLSVFGVPADAVAEFTLANRWGTESNKIGVRTNGSSVSRRVLDLHEAEDGGEDLGRMHVLADAASTIEFYHFDVSDAHAFLLTGYWQPECYIDEDCDDDNPCTDDACSADICQYTNNTASCDDGDACTVGDTCSDGACQGGNPPDCSGAGDQCNTASCDPAGAEGNCDILTPVTDGTDCDDGDACNTGETCQDGSCTGGSAVNCDAFDTTCADYECDPAGGEGNCAAMTPINEGGACDDGDACNTGETCQGGSCTGGSAVNCDAFDTTCADYECDPAGGEGNCAAMTPINEGSACDDGVLCTDSTCQLGSCVFTNHTGQITVNLEVDAVGTAVTRDVAFVITTCGGALDTREVPVAFDASGFGTAVLDNVDAGADWAQVREGHTLARLASLPWASCAVTVDLTGSNWLLSGDFQTAAVPQDGFVDITDFSILASSFNLPIDATLSTGADATGDGVQGTADFTAIQANFFENGDASDGCGGVGGGGGSGACPLVSATGWLVDGRTTPRASIGVESLPVANAWRADLNGDGVVNVEDIRAFAQKHDLQLLPEFGRELSR